MLPALRIGLRRPRAQACHWRQMAAAIAAVITFLLAALPAHAVLEIDLTRGNVEPMPIAVSPLFGAVRAESSAGEDIANVIQADLRRSGLFRPIERAAFLQTPADMQIIPRFRDWRQINAQALVTGTVDELPDGQIAVEYRLWDVFAEQHMVGLRLVTPSENWRRVAHIIADSIYKRITGESGYFDTRIVYVAESGPAGNRIKRLAIMDQDGANHRFLTDGSHLVLTPRFSPTVQEITYLSYVDGKPRIYLYNIESGKQEVLGDFPSMTFAPRFSPDGNRVIMSLSNEGNSDIYTMDLHTRQVERLTDHPAIDTSPCYSPDGERIVFNSDRAGRQQLYVIGAGGDSPQRISFGEGRYATPVWTPRGDLIAFTKMSGGRFYIGVMGPDGSGERLLTEGYLVEGPTWAPNGRVLMFFRQFRGGADGGGAVRLFTIDITGANEREVKTPLDASDPAWSPLIP